MDKSELILPLSEGFQSRAPVEVAEAAAEAVGLFSEEFGLLDSQLGVEEIPSTGKALSPVAVLQSEDNLFVVRSFPESHGVINLGGSFAENDTLTESYLANEQTHTQAMWPTQVIANGSLTGTAQEGAAALGFERPLKVCASGATLLYLVSEHEATRLVMCDTDQNRLAADLVLRYFFGDGADGTTRTRYTIKAICNRGALGFVAYVMTETLTLSHTGSGDNTLPVWSVTATTHGLRSVSVVSGAVQLGSEQALTEPVVGDSVVSDMVSDPYTTDGNFLILWRHDATFVTGSWSIRRYATSGSGWASIGSTGTVAAVDAWPLPVVNKGTQTKLYCGPSWIHVCGAKSDGAVTSVWLARVTPDAGGGAGVHNPALALGATVIRVSQYDSASATLPGVGFFTNSAGASQIALFYTSLEAPEELTVPAPDETPFLGITWSVEEWTAGAASFVNANRDLRMGECALYLDPVSAVRSGERVCLFGVGQLEALDPAVELWALRGDAGVAIAPVARFGVDQARAPASDVDRGHAVCVGGLVIGAFKAYTSGDLPPTRHAALTLTVELWDTGSGNWPPRAAKAGRKSYLAGGIASVFDGVYWSEMAVSWAPHPRVQSTAGSPDAANVLMYRWADHQGEIHRSGVCPQFEVTSYTVGNPVGSRMMRTLPAVELAAWALDATGGGVSYFALPALSSDVRPTRATMHQTWVDKASAVATFPAIPYADGTSAGELQSWAPPALWDLIAVGNRLVAIDATNRRRILYTKEKLAGVEYEWAAELEVFLPAQAGDGVGLAEFDGNVVVVAEHGVYVVGGEGYSNTLTGANFAPPRRVSDIKTARNKRNTVTSFAGGVFWEAEQGYSALVSGWQVKRLHEVRPRARRVAVHMPARNEIWLCGHDIDLCLVWNYLLDRWSRSNTVLDAFGESNTALLGVSPDDPTSVFLFYVEEGGPAREPSAYTSRWAYPAGLSGRCSFHEATITGLLLDSGAVGEVIRVSVKHDFGSTVRDVDVPISSLHSATGGRLVSFPVRLNGDGRAVQLGISVKTAGGDIGTAQFLPIDARICYATSNTGTKTKAGAAR